MNIPILRFLDKIVGIQLVKILFFFKKKIPKHKKDNAQVERILLIKLFGFGNFIFLSPLIREIKKTYPSASLDVLTFSQNKEICQMYTEVKTIHTIRFSMTGALIDTIKFVISNKKKYDVCMDLEQFVRFSAILGLLISPKKLVGIPTKESGKHVAYDEFILYKEDKHIVEEYFNLIKIFRVNYKKNIYLIRPKFKSSNVVKKIVRKTSGNILIGICPGSRTDDIERRYPKEKFISLINLILSKNKNIKIIFFGSKDEKKYIKEIINGIKNKDQLLDVSGISLNDSTALISKCHIFISNDTGPLHLAAALGVFCVGLYGPSKEWIYGPYTDKKIILRDKKHKPVRSNHNEKDIGWNSDWWPSPQYAYKKILPIIKNVENKHFLKKTS